jgi:hypothetical protein
LAASWLAVTSPPMPEPITTASKAPPPAAGEELTLVCCTGMLPVRRG